MSGSRDIIPAEYRELFDGAVQKKKLDADDITTSRPRKWPAAVSKVNRTFY